MIRLVYFAAALLAGLAVLAIPDVGEPGSGLLTAEVLRERECRVLEQRVTRLIQSRPQRVDEIETLEWCKREATVWLSRRTFWRIDGTTTRSEQETPSSHSTVLWQESAPATVPN